MTTLRIDRSENVTAQRKTGMTFGIDIGKHGIEGSLEGLGVSSHLGEEQPALEGGEGGQGEGGGVGLGYELTACVHGAQTVFDGSLPPVEAGGDVGPALGVGLGELAAEFGLRGVRVNAVAPGPVPTPRFLLENPALAEKLVASLPAADPASPRKSRPQSPTSPVTTQPSPTAPSCTWTAGAPPSEAAHTILCWPPSRLYLTLSSTAIHG